MIKRQSDEFEEELSNLIQKWASKPLDDGLTFVEMIGIMQMHIMQLYCVCHNIKMEDDNESPE